MGQEWDWAGVLVILFSGDLDAHLSARVPSPCLLGI